MEYIVCQQNGHLCPEQASFQPLSSNKESPMPILTRNKPEELWRDTRTGRAHCSNSSLYRVILREHQA